MTHRFRVLLYVSLICLSVEADNLRRIPKLDDLRQKQERCFDNALPCVLLLNEKGSVGCAQCETSSVSSEVLELTNEADYNEQIEASRHIVIAPESFALRERGLLKKLLGKGANAVIVAQQLDYWDKNELSNSGRNFPYPPIIPHHSEDNLVPNEDYLFDINGTTSGYPAIPFATRTLSDRFTFPVFYVSSEDVHVIRSTREFFLKDEETEKEQQQNNEQEEKKKPKKQKIPTAPIFKMQATGRMSACPPIKSPLPSPNVSPQPEEAIQTPKGSETNSTECLKKNTCYPVGGYSVWSSLSPINETTFNRSNPDNRTEIVAVTAPMDSSALFHDLAYGAAAEASSVAVLMAVVKSVSDYWRKKKPQTFTRYPMYFAFNGQSYGFAGSGRLLEDVSRFDCKEPDKVTGYCRNPVASSLKFRALNISNFTVINLGGLVSQDSRDANPEVPSGRFFIHGHKRGNPARTGGFAERLLKKQFSFSGNLSLSDGFRSAAFIDASQSFQYYRVQSDVVTITNFEKNFTNSFYHSPYDNATLIAKSARSSLHNVAAAVAKTVIEMCFDDPTPSVSLETELIDEFILCLTTSWEKRNCSLAKKYLGEEEYAAVYKKVRGSNYAGVFVPPDFFKDFNPSGYGKTLFLQKFMAFHNRYEPSGKLESISCTNNSVCNTTLGERENSNLDSVDNFRSTYCSRSECVLAESHLHAAFGTGLIDKNEARTEFDVVLIESPSPVPSPKDEKEVPPTATPVKPAWTESMWENDLRVCYTIQDSVLFGGVVLGTGLLTFIICLAVAFFLNPKSRKQCFRSDVSETQPLTDPILP